MRKIIVTHYLYFLFLISSAYSQIVTWEKTYGIPDRYDVIGSVCISYDYGFYLGINVNSGDYQNIWLVKTDINGNILWSKLFYNFSYNFIFNSLDSDDNGNLIICGETDEYDDWGDPFIMKIDGCGQKLWCKALHFPGMNYSMKVRITEDNHYIMSSRYASYNYVAERNQLWKFDSMGNEEFVAQIVPQYSYPRFDDEDHDDFIITEDKGFLMTGYCYFPLDTTKPNGQYILQHMIVKTDSLGNEEWIRPMFLDSNHMGELIANLEYSGNYYSVGYQYLPYPLVLPYFGKFSQTGQLIYEKTLHSDTLMDYIIGIKEVPDYKFILVGRVGPDLNTPPIIGIFKTDMLGNITNSLQNNHGSPVFECIARSIDNKYVITGYTPYNPSNLLQFDGYMIKINKDLEYDTIYNFPFVYDSLCPFPIPTDTIDCNCDLITGFGEAPGKKKTEEVKIFPNPARDGVNIVFSGGSGREEIKDLVVYDVFGKRVMGVKIGKELRLDVSGLAPGIYMVLVDKNGIALARAKMIVVR